MKKFSFVFSSVIFLFLLLNGCVSRLGSFTVISTKNIDWSRTNEYTRYNSRVKGEDICHIVIIIPTKANITIEDAVDNALAQVPGGIALVDAVLRSKLYYIPYIYGQQSYIVEGSVLVDPKLAVINPDETIYYQGTYDKKNNLTVLQISKDEYLEFEYDLKEADKEAEIDS